MPSKLPVPENASQESKDPPAFSSAKEMLDFVRKKYFAVVRPGDPFLLVVRLLARELWRCNVVSSEYRLALEENLYAGVFAEGDEPLLSCNAAAIFPKFTLRTAAFVEAPKEAVKRAELSIPLNNVWRTPLDKPFLPPASSHHQEVSAFALASGFEEMEALCLREPRVARDQVEWYVKVARRLGFPIVSPAMRSALAALREQAFVELIDAWASASPKVSQKAARAVALGLDKVREPMHYNGARVWPRLFLKDLVPELVAP